ncbi:unnamed protein product [[Candida] boidinii]|nr:unnamed protein product [[Candida] boidinii]
MIVQSFKAFSNEFVVVNGPVVVVAVPVVVAVVLLLSIDNFSSIVLLLIIESVEASGLLSPFEVISDLGEAIGVGVFEALNFGVDGVSIDASIEASFAEADVGVGEDIIELLFYFCDSNSNTKKIYLYLY